MTLKILDALRATPLRREMPRSGRTIAKSSIAEDFSPMDSHVVFRFSTECFVELKGPREAEDHLRDQAVTVLKREIYGEVLNDLHDIREIAWEETYRPHDDLLLAKLNEIIDRIRT